MRIIRQKIEDGPYSVEAILTRMEEGACVCLGGGHSHVGVIVLALPRESLLKDGSVSSSTSVINMLGHKDDVVALPLAERLCREFNMPVTVTAGIHIDLADDTDIRRICHNVDELTRLLCEALRQEQG